MCHHTCVCAIRTFSLLTHFRTRFPTLPGGCVTVVFPPPFFQNSEPEGSLSMAKWRGNCSKNAQGAVGLCLPHCLPPGHHSQSPNCGERAQPLILFVISQSVDVPFTPGTCAATEFTEHPVAGQNRKPGPGSLGLCVCCGDAMS